MTEPSPYPPPLTRDGYTYHITRLALAGKVHDAHMLARMYVRRTKRNDSPADVVLADLIEQLLADSPIRPNPLRGGDDR